MAARSFSWHFLGIDDLYWFVVLGKTAHKDLVSALWHGDEMGIYELTSNRPRRQQQLWKGIEVDNINYEPYARKRQSSIGAKMVQNAVYGAQYHFMLSVVQVQISRLTTSIRIASLFCRSLPLIALPTWFSRLLCLIHHKFYKMLLVEYRFKIRQLSNRSKCEKKQKNCTVPDSSFLLAEDLLDIQMQASLLTWVTSISSFSRKYIQPSFILCKTTKSSS